MTAKEPPSTEPGDQTMLTVVTQEAKELSSSDGFQQKIYQAISVQRPVVIEYLKSVRRDKPDATVEEVLKELERRYVAAVTASGTGVGASAAIPAVGIPLAVGLGVADLLFFYETSALFVLAAAELHGIEVTDAERARPLVFGMLLGQKSQSKVSTIVMQAAVPGGLTAARATANATAKAVLPKGWGEVLTQQMPDSALAPVAAVMAREALKASGKVGSRMVGKVLPFGIGAVIGGVGSFTFGRDVVKATHVAFPTAPKDFPEVLRDFAKPERGVGEPSRAMRAMQAAASGASDFGEAAWGKAKDVGGNFRSAGVDEDGMPREARALTAVKRAGSAVKGAATGGVGAVVDRVKQKK
jgi:hypothetical protein